MNSILTHRKVRTTFKSNPRTGFLGSLSRTFKSTRFDQQIGELFEIISREMVEDKIVFSYPSTFSLINITNLVSNRSVGYSVSPPQEILHNATGLVFTFALTARPYSDDLPEIETLSLGSDGAETISYWSSKRASVEYFSIAITKNGWQKLNLSANLDSDLIYIYNTIGALTKSFVLEHDWYRENRRHKSINNPSVNEYTLYSKYYQSTFKNVMVNSPMNTWIYNKDFWMQAQNLLSKSYLDIQNFGLYYLLYLADEIPSSPQSSIYKDLHSDVGGIYDYITQGIQDFTQCINHDHAEITDPCYAIIHLLENLVFDGGLGLAVDKDSASLRLNSYKFAFELNPHTQGDFYSFFSNGKKSYLSLIKKDIRLVRIVEEIL